MKYLAGLNTSTWKLGSIAVDLIRARTSTPVVLGIKLTNWGLLVSKFDTASQKNPSPHLPPHPPCIARLIKLRPENRGDQQNKNVTEKPSKADEEKLRGWTIFCTLNCHLQTSMVITSNYTRGLQIYPQAQGSAWIETNCPCEAAVSNK